MTAATRDLMTLMLPVTAGVALAALLFYPTDAQAEEQAIGLPKLGFRQEPHPQHKTMPYVSATFPEVPGFTCESWCYESATEFLGKRELEGGKLELRHRDTNQPQVIYVTTVTPEPGAVDFSVRAVVDREGHPDAKLPAALQPLNLCFQLRKAEGFCSQPDPYPEFVKRCFLFADKGRTFLLDTHRRPALHRYAADHQYNNPPWVQMYVGVWHPAPGVQGTGWAEYSTDRYTVPVIGTVSRDGKHLTALVNDSADMMAQAWHDCLHNNAKWLPAGAPPEEQRWRVKVYVMENDPDALLKRVAEDMPDAMKLQEKRVPEK
jgi:hypothetical protein